MTIENTIYLYTLSSDCKVNRYYMLPQLGALEFEF